MRVRIIRQEEGSIEKIAEVYDSYYVSMIIGALIDEAHELGKTSFVVDVDFPEVCKDGGENK